LLAFVELARLSTGPASFQQFTISKVLAVVDAAAGAFVASLIKVTDEEGKVAALARCQH